MIETEHVRSGPENGGLAADMIKHGEVDRKSLIGVNIF